VNKENFDLEYMLISGNGFRLTVTLMLALLQWC